MSTNESRLPLAEAEKIALELGDLLDGQCERFEIAGSIRRQKPTIGDIEMVAIPKGRELWNRLDKLVYDGIVSKALYVDKNGNSAYRWGDVYRGIFYKGIKAEIFTADADNWGFQLWLRTGPADSNTFVMTKLIRENHPLRFSEGYGWYVPSKGERVRLSICDEKTLFRCLGLDYFQPKFRTEGLYRAEWTGAIDSAYLLSQRVPIKQRSMFG